MEGVALGVIPKFRNLGIGKELMKIGEKIAIEKNCDYIYGQHLVSLKNLDEWLKFGRRLIANFGGLYVTIKDLI
jgi:GNAT superfamily N-acetyltransferase